VKVDIGVNENIRDALSRMVAQHERFDGFNRDLERRFQRAEMRVEKFLEMSSQLHKSCENLFHIAIGDDKNLTIQHAMDVVLVLLDYVDNFIKETKKLTEEIDYCNEALTPLLAFEAQLIRVFKPLKFARALFLMESANLPDSRKEIFVALSHEIADMYTQVCDLSSNELKRFYEVYDSINSVSVELKREIFRQQESVSDEKSGMKQYQYEIKRDFEHDRSVSVSFSNISAEISDHIQEVVASVKADKDLGKKLEQVINVTGKLIERGKVWIEEGADMADRETISYMFTTSKVQVSQINSIIQEFKDRESLCSTKLETIQEQLEMLDGNALALKEFRVLTTTAGGIVEFLIKAINEAFDMIRKEISEAEAVYAVMAPFSGISSNITTTLKDLSNKLRLVVLNAQLKAAKVGRGTGLEVLASNVCAISDEAQGISLKVGDELNIIAKSLATIINTFDDLRARGLEKEKEYLDIAGKAADNLHAFRDRGLNAMREYGNQVDLITELNSELRSELGIDFSAIQYLENYTHCLNEFIRIARISKRGTD